MCEFSESPSSALASAHTDLPRVRTRRVHCGGTWARRNLERLVLCLTGSVRSGHLHRRRQESHVAEIGRPQ